MPKGYKKKYKEEVLEKTLHFYSLSPREVIDMLEGYLCNPEYKALRFVENYHDEWMLVADRLETDQEFNKRVKADKKRKATMAKNKEARLAKLRKEVAKLEREVG